MVDLGVGRDGGGKAVGVAAAKDYIYGRLEELRPVILSERGARRQEAKDERDFLQQELAKVLRQGRGAVDVAPRLARAVRERASLGSAASPREAPRTVFPLRPERQRAGHAAKSGGRSGAEVPPYWAACEKMNFRGLREFVDDALRTPPGPDAVGLPRARNEFVKLLELLADVGSVKAAGRPATAREALELDEMRAHRQRLSRALSEAQRASSAAEWIVEKRKASQRVHVLSRELQTIETKIERLEARQAASPGALAEKRWKIVRRIESDIERVFAQGGPGAGPSTDGCVGRAGGNRLPWRVLPPGELTLERVLAHYERLARERPGQHFVPERIEKAHSLDPNAWWEGHAGFGGYVVFEYPGTDRVLLECGVYGNAIYVLGPRWKELSRRSKREVMEDPSSRRIPHRGE